MEMTFLHLLHHRMGEGIMGSFLHHGDGLSRVLAFHEPNEPHPLRDEYDSIIKPFLLQAISAGHGVVSTSGCAGPVSQPLVTGMYQSVAHLDQVLSMLMCLVVVGLGASLSFGSFFSPSVVD